MTGENRRANAREEIRLGEDALKAAEALLALDLPNDAVSRAYYAAFHFARALLLLEGLQPKTHQGVVALLARHLEGEGALDPGAVSVYARLQTFRGLADYDVSRRLSRERATTEVAGARDFVEACRVVLAGRLDA